MAKYGSFKYSRNKYGTSVSAAEPAKTLRLRSGITIQNRVAQLTYQKLKLTINKNVTYLTAISAQLPEINKPTVITEHNFTKGTITDDIMMQNGKLTNIRRDA